jgi:hypothetical protein
LVVIRRRSSFVGRCRGWYCVLTIGAVRGSPVKIPFE